MPRRPRSASAGGAIADLEDKAMAAFNHAEWLSTIRIDAPNICFRARQSNHHNRNRRCPLCW